MDVREERTGCDGADARDGEFFGRRLGFPHEVVVGPAYRVFAFVVGRRRCVVAGDRIFRMARFAPCLPAANDEPPGRSALALVAEHSPPSPFAELLGKPDADLAALEFFMEPAIHKHDFALPVFHPFAPDRIERLPVPAFAGWVGKHLAGGGAVLRLVDGLDDGEQLAGFCRLVGEVVDGDGVGHGTYGTNGTNGRRSCVGIGLPRRWRAGRRRRA